MHTTEIELSGYRAIIGNKLPYLLLGTTGSKGNEKLLITRGTGWEGLTVKAVFHPQRVEVLIPESGEIDVPWEITIRPLRPEESGKIVFHGMDEATGRVLITNDILYKVTNNHSPTDGTPPGTPTPSVWEQWVANAGGVVAEAAEVVGREAALCEQISAATATSAGNAASSASEASVSAEAAVASAEAAKQSAEAAAKIVDVGVDSTLTTSGAAADAAATGAKFTEQNTTVSALQRDLTDVRADIRRTPESIYCLHDADGNVVAYIDDNSVAHFYKITARNFGEATKNVENIEVDGTEVAMFPCYGQSWSVGYQTGAAISTSQNWDSLMFSGGAIPQESEAADPTGSFVPLVEQIYSTENAETPCSGQCNIIKELLDTENGLDLQNFGNYRLLSSAPGLGGAQISQLAKGTEPYDRLLSQVRQAKSICDSLGKNFSVPAISWIQGSTVAQEISQLQTDLNADIKAITGQKQDVKLITWEYYSSGSYTGYLLENSYVKEVHEMNSNVVCACPSYMLRYMGEGSATEAPTNIHFTAESSKWIGGYMGIAYKRLVLEKQDWQPLRPIAYTVDGNRIYIKFHVPVPPLRFNTTLVAKAENYGFEVTDYNGNFNEITDVSIVGTDTVKLTLSSSYNNAYNVTYADQRKAGYEGLGALYGRRGNLCDSQDIIFSELEKEMPNFCVVFGRSGLEG